MTYSSEVLADNPVGYWRMNVDGTGYVSDETGNMRGQLEGSWSSAADLVPENSDGAADNALNSWFESPTTSGESTAYTNITGDLTVEIWVNLDDVTGVGFASKENAWAFTLDANADIEVRHPGSTVACTLAAGLSTGTDYHLVFTRDASTRTWKLYIDGSLVDTQTYTSSEDPTSSSDRMYWMYPSIGLPTSGTIDEIAVYDSVLSASRITAHWNAANGITASGPSFKVRDGAAWGDTTAKVRGSSAWGSPTSKVMSGGSWS